MSINKRSVSLLKISLLILLFFLSTQSFSQGTSYWNTKLENADALLKRGMYRQALDEYIVIAENTASMYAQFQVGWIYSNGLGVQKSCWDAARWYTLAANRGHHTAQNNLFALYSTGCPDLPRNMPLAVQMLKRAVESNNARAMANLSILYAEGNGVEENEFRAFDYANRSAQAGDPLGKFYLSLFYFDGTGVPASKTRSTELLHSLAISRVERWDERIKQRGQLILGQNFIIGDGVPRNSEEAYKWLTLAAAGPDAELSKQASEALEEIRGSITSARAQEIERIAQRQTMAGETEMSVDQLKDALVTSIEQNRDAQVVFLATQLSNMNDPFGQYIKGLILYDGFHQTAQDIDEAYIQFRRSCQQGFLYSCLEQASILVEQNRDSAALELLGHTVKRIPRTESEMVLRAAEIYVDIGDIEQAKILARRILIDDPANDKAREIFELDR